MLLKDKTVAIVGGGPAGLMLARLLQQKSLDVKVYERDRDQFARLIGSPLDMHEDSGLAAIREAGLLEAFKDYFRPGADRMLLMDAEASIHFSDHDTKPEAEFGDAYFRPEIDRAPLRQMLLESLEPETVVWDSHFLTMEPTGAGWMLHFKNGLSAYADLVVAADGANSKIRPYLTDTKPFYSGVTMLEGNVRDAQHAIPTIESWTRGGKIMAFGNRKNLLLGQKGNGDLGFYASFATDESWATTSGIDFTNRAQVLDWFRNYYPEWNPVWQTLFENAELPFIPRPIYCIPPNAHWNTKANVTLIGDAAHVMPPFAGEGANMALLDALELSRFLTDGRFNDLHDAIAAHEKEMHVRASAAAQESLDNGQLMHAPDALQTMLEFFGNH